MLSHWSDVAVAVTVTLVLYFLIKRRQRRSKPVGEVWTPEMEDTIPNTDDSQDRLHPIHGNVRVFSHHDKM